MAPILEQFEEMNNRLNAISDRLNVLNNRFHADVVMAYAVNGAAVNYTAPVQPVPRLLDMEVPHDFPETLGQLRNLSQAAVNGLLQFYDLPIHGTFLLARHRLFAHIGVRLEL